MGRDSSNSFRVVNFLGLNPVRDKGHKDKN